MAFAGKLAMAKAYRNRENRDKDMSENVYLPAVPKKRTKHGSPEEAILSSS